MSSQADHEHLIEINNAVLTIKDKNGTLIKPTFTTAESFFNIKTKGSDVLPPVIRGFSEDYRFVMIERPPHFEKVELAGSIEGQHEIAVPWTVWIFEFNSKKQPVNLWLYAIHEPIVTGDAMLFNFSIPNLDSECKTPDEFFPKKLSTFMSLADRLNQGMDRFWSTPFNLDVNNMHLIESLINIDESNFNEVLNLKLTPAAIPEVLNNWNAEHGHDYEYLTVANWIDFFEDTRSAKTSDSNTPVLDFIMEMLPEDESQAN